MTSLIHLLFFTLTCKLKHLDSDFFLLVFRSGCFYHHSYHHDLLGPISSCQPHSCSEMAFFGPFPPSSKLCNLAASFLLADDTASPQRVIRWVFLWPHMKTHSPLHLILPCSLLPSWSVTPLYRTLHTKFFSIKKKNHPPSPVALQNSL